MANVYFNDGFKVCSIDGFSKYLYIDNVKDFLKDCGDDWISDGVDRPGVYQWNSDFDGWSLPDFETDEKIRSLVKEVNSLHQENPSQNDNSIGWNILITLNTGEVIQTNSEPVSMNEVHEAIDILLKPSFFGKTIKEFKIVAV